MRTASLDRFGRIVIPKEVRDDLGLEAGTVVSIEETGEDSIMLRPMREDSAVVVKDGILVYAAKAGGDLVDAVRRQREGRLRLLLPRRRK